jgi:hypothetical protein
MTEQEMFKEHRRSSRVPLKITVDIETESGGMKTCSGETIIVNLHGALIHADCELYAGEKITIHVYLTGKSSPAKVVNVAGADKHEYGIELAAPKNIWGVPLPPSDWGEEQRH